VTWLIKGKAFSAELEMVPDVAAQIFTEYSSNRVF
jgi:hypothetical protein